MEDVLKFAIESGMIDLSYIQDKYEMNKREELLSKHKWAISKGKDGYWRTPRSQHVFKTLDFKGFSGYR